jgi:hypothetical protein
MSNLDYLLIEKWQFRCVCGPVCDPHLVAAFEHHQEPRHVSHETTTNFRSRWPNKSSFLKSQTPRCLEGESFTDR